MGHRSWARAHRDGGHARLVPTSPRPKGAQDGPFLKSAWRSRRSAARSQTQKSASSCEQCASSYAHHTEMGKRRNKSGGLSGNTVLLSALAALVALAVGGWLAFTAAPQQPAAPRVVPPPKVEAPPAGECVDLDEGCAGWAEGGECDANPSFMKAHCNFSCALCTGLAKPKSQPQRLPNSLQGKCRDLSSNCATWAGDGECENNAPYMRENCPLSCNSCPDGENNPNCVRHNATAAVREGEIGPMFESLLTDYPQYDVRVLSRDPWVVTLENFISQEEADHIRRCEITVYIVSRRVVHMTAGTFQPLRAPLRALVRRRPALASAHLLPVLGPAARLCARPHRQRGPGAHCRAHAHAEQQRRVHANRSLPRG